MIGGEQFESLSLLDHLRHSPEDQMQPSALCLTHEDLVVYCLRFKMIGGEQFESLSLLDHLRHSPEDQMQPSALCLTHEDLVVYCRQASS
jgi:hypothetical protein